MKVKVYSNQGVKKTPVEVALELGNADQNEALIAQAMRVYLANRRRPIAHTKNRGEVSGGGRKPFRQKGTGNARAGSTRSPLWIGGGITFGPRKTRNFTLRLSKKMAKKAIRYAIAEKITNKKFIVVEDLGFKEVSTAKVQDFLEKMPIEGGSILVILSKTEPNTELSMANLKYARTVQISGVNLFDLLKYDYVLVDKAGLKKLEDWLLDKKSAPKLEKKKV